MTGETSILKVMNLSKKRNEKSFTTESQRHREKARRHCWRVLEDEVCSMRTPRGISLPIAESRELFTTN